jgi:hypothetical protein
MSDYSINPRSEQHAPLIALATELLKHLEDKVRMEGRALTIGEARFVLTYAKTRLSDVRFQRPEASC